MSSPDHPIWGSRGPSLAPSSTIPDNKYSVLSDTEKLIIAECQDEAFYYRSLPLAISFGWGTHTLHGLGWCRVQGLPPGVARWGVVCGAGALGFSMGQFAYSNICADKFLKRAPEGVIALDIRMKGMCEVFLLLEVLAVSSHCVPCPESKGTNILIIHIKYYPIAFYFH